MNDIEEAFECYVKRVYPNGVTPEQRKQVFMAFVAGAHTANMHYQVGTGPEIAIALKDPAMKWKFISKLCDSVQADIDECHAKVLPNPKDN